LATKQTLRVVSKQVAQQQGGVDKIASELFGMAVDQALHLIDTIGMAWNGMAWGITTIKDTIQQMHLGRTTRTTCCGTIRITMIE
jgi:hypothetical protein